MSEEGNNINKGGDAKKRRQSSKTMIIVIILLVILVVIGGVLIFIMLRDKQPDVPAERPTLTGGRGVIATEDNIQELLEQLEQPVEDAHYLVNMSVRLVFDTWDKSARGTYIKNDSANNRTVYIDIFLDDENGNRGELIYSSPYIPVGQELRNFSLDREVAAGEYSTSIVYYLVDDEYEFITDLVLGVKLIINE